MSHKKTTSSSLTHKTTATELIKTIKTVAPYTKISLRWCPRHEGIEGNTHADHLATTAAKAPLPDKNIEKPTLFSYRAAVKDWAKTETLKSYTPQDVLSLGHQPHPTEHLAALAAMKNKHLVSTITQLRTGHIPLLSYLFKRNLKTDPTCPCGTAPENV